MLWKGRRQSSNIEDRRGNSGGRFGSSRGGFGMSGGRMRMPRMPMPRGRRAKAGGIGGIGLVVVVIIMLVMGVDPSVLLQGGMPMGGGQPAGYSDGPAAPRSAAEEELKAFISVVLADTEETWHNRFREMGSRYEEPTLVLFTGAVRSACGSASSAMGPFYCPGDRKVYLDMSFFDELARRFGAPGDFAQAYVVAHEVGHHIQTLLGISERVHAARRQMSKAEGNKLSVRQELQADCFAGIWGHYADNSRNLVEPGDIDEGLRAATAIGDDTLQRKAQGYVVPESFTHGTADQRRRWFRKGYESGSMEDCDTFSTDRL